MACAIGAGIGGLLALDIFSTAFCWVGFLLGGLAGYLSYEWKKTIKAIPRAYWAAAGFRFPIGYLKYYKWIFLILFDMFFWISFIFILLLLLSAESHLDWLETIFLMSVSVLMGWLFSCFFVSIFLFLAFKEDERCDRKCDEKEIDQIRHLSFVCFPPIVIFWHLPRGVVFITMFVAKRTPSFIVWFFNGCILVACEWGRFSWKKFFLNFFLIIHSEIRFLCGVDAMIGAGIGYFVGSAVIGALAGTLFGVFNYLVITEFCLKRIWRVIPIKS